MILVKIIQTVTREFWNLSAFAGLYIAIISGAIGGALAFVGGDYLLRWLHKPSLLLEFRDNKDCKSPTPMNKDDVETEGYYIRIKVTNENRHIAKDCRAYLINFERKDENNGFVRTEYCDSIPLGWSCRDKKDRFRGIDIPRGINQYVDVIATVKDSSVYIPQIMVPPYRYSKLFEKKGIFQFTIQVTADDANPKTIKLILNWKGDWDNFDVYPGD